MLLRQFIIKCDGQQQQNASNIVLRNTPNERTLVNVEVDIQGQLAQMNFVAKQTRHSAYPQYLHKNLFNLSTTRCKIRHNYARYDNHTQTTCKIHRIKVFATFNMLIAVHFRLRKVSSMFDLYRRQLPLNVTDN